jgi:hypothetical protein
MGPMSTHPGPSLGPRRRAALAWGPRAAGTPGSPPGPGRHPGTGREGGRVLKGARGPRRSARPPRPMPRRTGRRAQLRPGSEAASAGGDGPDAADLRAILGGGFFPPRVFCPAAASRQTMCSTDSDRPAIRRGGAHWTHDPGGQLLRSPTGAGASPAACRAIRQPRTPPTAPARR